MWRTCLQGQRDLGGQLGISLFISLLSDLVALSFPSLISYIFKVYCDEIWLYLCYKGFWSSLGSSLWRKIVGSGCQSSGWPRSLLYLVWKKKKKSGHSMSSPSSFCRGYTGTGISFQPREWSCLFGLTHSELFMLVLCPLSPGMPGHCGFPSSGKSWTELLQKSCSESFSK